MKFEEERRERVENEQKRFRPRKKILGRQKAHIMTHMHAPCTHPGDQ
jgi:hypothetical protein